MRSVAAAALALGVVLAGSVPGRAQFCAACLFAEFWSIDPELWRGATRPSFPEQQAGAGLRASSFGIAFSGGGTRSATATVGQLRGLLQNGWLDKVQYVTAVSGGSWAAVPFTYARAPWAELLGAMESPGSLTTSIIDRRPAGRLLQSVVDARIGPSALAETLELLARRTTQDRELDGAPLDSIIDGIFGPRGSADQTYADILADIFIAPHVPDWAARHYTWNDASAARLAGLNAPRFARSDFLTAAPNRPFLIVGGTIIYDHPAYDYPRLVPIELTPLYTGVRQQFGGRLGGGYVSPLAYDAEAADLVDQGVVRVVGRGEDRRFTLADAIASSGAAPLLTVFRGRPLPQLRAGTAFFPQWNHFAVRAEGSGRAVTRPSLRGLSHGDGGFTDNLGLMPLLARQVKNVLVFVNASGPFETSADLQSLFVPIDRRRDWGGDRTDNVVFAPELWIEVRNELERDTRSGRAAVFCGRDWTVRRNELYNISGYSGLNICVVYNHRAENWNRLLPADTQHELARARRFRSFPWLATFGENVPRVIRLQPAQVTLLANLAAWTVTNDDSLREISEGLCDVLAVCRDR